jgi:UDP-2-acetamido-2,6-beta-L-arabino-hexul-4-ose reductase
MKRVKLIRPGKVVDHRGWLQKILMRQQLDDENEFGEIYLTMTMAGESRACHYHEKTIEWFHPIKGSALLLLKDLETGEEDQIVLDEKSPVVVNIAPRIVHYLTNNSSAPFYLLAYANRPYDPSDPDTFTVET